MDGEDIYRREKPYHQLPEPMGLRTAIVRYYRQLDTCIEAYISLMYVIDRQ